VTAAEDHQTRRAVASLVRRLRERDAAIAAGSDDVPDYEWLATEYIMSLRGQGWRWLRNLAPARTAPTGDAATPDNPGRQEARAIADALAERDRLAREQGRM
jgi:hypothetical protein